MIRVGGVPVRAEAKTQRPPGRDVIDRNLRVNEQIRISPVRVINAEGAMLGVMQILEQVSKSQGRQPEMLQTHPYPEHRIETINAWLKKNFPNGVPGELTVGRKLSFEAR